MKKILSTITLAAAGSIMLAGCGSSGGTVKGSPAPLAPSSSSSVANTAHATPPGHQKFTGHPIPAQSSPSKVAYSTADTIAYTFSYPKGWETIANSSSTVKPQVDVRNAAQTATLNVISTIPTAAERNIYSATVKNDVETSLTQKGLQNVAYKGKATLAGAPAVLFTSTAGQANIEQIVTDHNGTFYIVTLADQSVTSLASEYKLVTSTWKWKS